MRIRTLGIVGTLLCVLLLLVSGCSFFGGQDARYTHWEPDLSPDGRYLVYESDDDGDLELYLRDLETDAVRRITDNEEPDWSPSWSPDGRFVAFASVSDENVDIYTVDIDSLEVLRLTSHEGDDINASWGTDGLIYFNSNRTDDWEIYTIQPDGSQLQQLTQVEAPNRE